MFLDRLVPLRCWSMLGSTFGAAPLVPGSTSVLLHVPGSTFGAAPRAFVHFGAAPRAWFHFGAPRALFHFGVVPLAGSTSVLLHVLCSICGNAPCACFHFGAAPRAWFHLRCCSTFLVALRCWSTCLVTSVLLHVPGSTSVICVTSLLSFFHAPGSTLLLLQMLCAFATPRRYNFQNSAQHAELGSIRNVFSKQRSKT